MSIHRPTGEQYEISSGGYRAVITEQGADLRVLSFEGRDLVLSSPEDSPVLCYRGALVAPWPNRVVDGRYPALGTTQQLALTEPERTHALHGLSVFVPWRLEEHHADSVTLSLHIWQVPGYPFELDLTVTYALDAQGLTTTVSATNVGETAPAPFGCCPHPYLVAGTDTLEDWTVTAPASEVLEVTEDRLVPTGTAPVSGIYDLRDGLPLDGVFLDHAFTGIDFSGGEASVRVTSPTGTGTKIVFGPGTPWVQVHTGDRPEPELNRKGLAVEPMTCPPDAYNSRTDLIELDREETASASWRIAAI